MADMTGFKGVARPGGSMSEFATICFDTDNSNAPSQLNSKFRATHRVKASISSEI